MTAPRIPRTTMRHAAAWPEPFEHDTIAPVQPYKPAAMDYMAGYEDCRRALRCTGILTGMGIGFALASAVFTIFAAWWMP